ncbi:hypothetical protein CONPUDRAFT_157654 [Coniophora puteana RWD-64-598 SS2]|uniref:DUF6534 domain-containing protein n=1 Tax=Coniophora puteana (strain RWD-64-598) TaxID=741705 RepID=A0A5M3MF28_CONPW|nr:uncharacterized protein CONPUDRAFT_157654 [Coniophora puteana RWD-64-598 SS2]EIW77404.1 hypothetical protein CONPUDRAFT_157654 [Coniophora puteana RWD-64-598 SS2]
MAHNVELLFGPMLIGVFINSILYGVTIVQAFIYFGNSTRHVLLPCITDVGITSSSDPRWIRYFVVYLLVAESLNTIFDIGVMYEPLVHLWGDERAMIYVPVMVVPDAIITVLISTPVQLFLAWRVRAMSESLVIPGFICLFTTTSFLGGLATGIAVSFLNEYSQFHQFEGAPIGWLVSSAVADALIAASLVWSLYQKKTGVPSTDDLVNRIIRLTVQTGMVTATAAILDVSLFIASTTTL